MTLTSKELAFLEGLHQLRAIDYVKTEHLLDAFSGIVNGEIDRLSPEKRPAKIIYFSRSADCVQT